MEPKLGEIFTRPNGKKYETVKIEFAECSGCAFINFATCTVMNCIGTDRDDGANVIFKEVKPEHV